MRKTVIILFISLIVTSTGLWGQSGDFSGMPQKTYWWFGKQSSSELQQNVKPVSQHPPFCGKKRRNNGMVLPLPFGTGLNISVFEQPYYSKNLRMYSTQNDLTARADTLYQDTQSGEMSMAIRPDFWLFPFLNVYGVFGYSAGRTTPNMKAPSIVIENVPGIGELEIDTTIELKDKVYYNGPLYGFGATVSTGFKSYFILLNYEYSVTQPTSLEDDLVYQRFSAKLGILLGRNNKKAKGSFWLGTMYMDDNHHFEGEVDVKDIMPGFEVIFGDKATYTADVEATHPWNFIFGGSLMVNYHHILMLEMGFFQRQQASLSYTFRF